MKKKSQPEYKAPIIKQLADPAFKSLVDSAIADMEIMENKILATTNMSEEEAKLKVQQIYFKNLQTFSDPVNAAVSLMAELKTRIDLDRVMHPEEAMIDDKYLRLLEEMRKTTKLLMDAKGKVVTHEIQRKDDNEMKFADFIDVEDD